MPIKNEKISFSIKNKNNCLHSLIGNISMHRMLTKYQYQWFSAFNQLYNFDCLFILVHLLGNVWQSRQIVFLSYRIMCTQKSLSICFMKFIICIKYSKIILLYIPVCEGFAIVEKAVWMYR